MKTRIIILSLIALFQIPAFAQQKAAAQIAKTVSVSEFEKLMNAKPGLILDVRTPGEVTKGKIEGSTNINFFDDDFELQISKLDKSKPVYVYCASGGRSGEAMDMMKTKGFSEVYNLDGGYTAWKAAHNK